MTPFPHLPITGKPQLPIVVSTQSSSGDQSNVDITHTLQMLANASANIATTPVTVTQAAPVVQAQQNVVTVQGATAGTMGQAFIQGMAG